MLISHTIQIVDRDQIQNGKNISGSISFTFEMEKKRKKYWLGLNFCQSVYLNLYVLYPFFGVTLTSNYIPFGVMPGSYFQPTNRR